MNQRPLVFMTGATGFIGSRVAQALARDGYPLRCLVRPTSETGPLSRLGAELVAADACDADAVARALTGADHAIHLAAIYDVGVVDDAALERVNIGGTRAFLDGIRRARTARAVYVSTTGALGPVSLSGGDPERPYAGPYPSTYHRTKSEAHRLARTAQEAGLPLVVVCPAFVYGPGDRGPGGRLVHDVMRGRVPALLADAGTNSFVHVDDAAAGIVAALERGATDGVYVLSGEATSINDVAVRASKLAGRRPPRFRLGRRLALGLGTVFDAVSRVTGLRFGVTREGVAVTAGLDWAYRDERSRRDLGWSPRSLDEGLPEMVESFRTAGT